MQKAGVNGKRLLHTWSWVVQVFEERSLPVVWVVLFALCLAATALNPRFLNAFNLVNILRQGVPVGTIAVGLTFVMLAGGVDLSSGPVASLSAVLAAGVMSGQNGRIGCAVALVLAIGIACGLVNGVLVTKRKLAPFVLTLSTGIVIQGINQLISGGTAYGVLAPAFREVLNARIGVVPAIVVVFLAIFTVCLVVQNATAFGRSVYLVGGNPEAARLSGLPVDSVQVWTYVIAGLLASVSGLFILARYGVTGTYAGQGLSFEALAAVILGGTTFEGGRGGLGGTFAGVMILMLAFNLVNILGLSYHWQLIVRGGIIVAGAVLYAGRRNGS